MSGRIRPVFSASAMNASGYRKPRSGCCQRTSASTPTAVSVAQVGLGLEVQDELVVVDRAAQVGDQREVLAVVGVGGAVVERVAAVGALGRVHGDVGVLEQRLGVLAVLGVERDPDARLDLDADVLELEALGDRRAHAGRRVERVLGAADVGEQDGELVAAEAGDRVARPQRRGQALADRAQQQVAVVVAERVVDLLEAVEVDHQHGDGAAFTGGAAGGLVHAVVEEDAVRQLGHVVVERGVLARGGLHVQARRRAAPAHGEQHIEQREAGERDPHTLVCRPRPGNLSGL